MAKNVQMPDGSVVEFPDGMSDEQIGDAITRNQLSSGAGAPKFTVGAPSQTPMKTFNLASAGQDIADVGTGASQGAANTVGSTVGLVSKALNKIPGIGEYLAPTAGINALEQRTKDRSTPENTAQHVGKIAEQTAEFFLPDAALSDTAKALEVAKDAPAAAKIFSMAARGALSGAGTAGVTAAQGGSAGDVLTSGATGAVTPALADAITSGGERAAKGIYTRLIRPGAKEFTLDEARSAGTALANAAPVAASKRALLQKTLDLKSETGKQIGDLIDQATQGGKTLDISDALQPIETAMKNADDAGNPGLYRQLQDLHDSITHVYENGQPLEKNQILQRLYSLNNNGAVMPNKFVLRDLTSMSPAEANTLKRNIQGDVNFITPNADALNNTGKAAQGKIVSILRREIPDLGPLNDQYSGLSNAATALRNATVNEERRNPFSLSDMLLSGAAGGVGLTHSPLDAAITSGLTFGGKKIAESTLMKTLSAAAAKNVAGGRIPVTALRNFYLAQH